ncbi:vWA domain-containing protein [Streptomyces griseorubiginosus]|uniref:vWA domain-containing protein n=1 Tax=Streptomyces griseorubiginosus TaxID=67304 RepID=UPI002E7FED56|nr:von Willebrand factor type A domain-containing protein [Streptomyces griseorubiginosus]WUB46953.1 von Willebrand factor type A domain-containing protein [Streptomyces griseorubiginosus]WUB55475.1 von Willebrand factor type A domain-containing protein [Streptomyces griseorubiginosus]
MERQRTRQVMLALTLAGGLLLTGCSGGDDSGSKSSADGSKGGSYGSAFPAPDQLEGEQGSEESRDYDSPEPQAPDYLSTFALDVDTASYGYARRTLAEGRLPDPSTIRPEEFVNSFRQDYDRPDGNGFTVTVDGARTDRDGWSLVRVGLATREARDQDDDRPPAALTFVIDISGSMAEPGRLDLAQQSLDTMTERLHDDDSVAIVTFSDEAETVLPMTRLGGHRDRVHEAIDGLEPTYSTNLGAGVETGYRTAVDGLREGATNRVVLISDALANDGDTDPDSILDRIDTARREDGITLFGVGVGSDYGDALMERLADKGDGHTVYVSGADDAEKVFCEQLPQNIDLTARDAKAQVAFDPETVKQFRLIGYDNRRVADDDFRDDRVDGGEVGPGHTVTALYAVRTKPGAEGHLATATVRWQDPETRAPHEKSAELETFDDSLREANSRFQVDAVAAYFADLLRGTYDDERLPGRPSTRELADWADQLADRTEDSAVRQLADAIRRARLLAD